MVCQGIINLDTQYEFDATWSEYNQDARDKQGPLKMHICVQKHQKIYVN